MSFRIGFPSPVRLKKYVISTRETPRRIAHLCVYGRNLKGVFSAQIESRIYILLFEYLPHTRRTSIAYVVRIA